MEIIEATKEEFNRIITDSFFQYGNGDFNDLNKHKCEIVFYLLFKKGKYRLGITGGIMNGNFLSPYSAPFGSFSFVRKGIKSEYIDSAIDLLIEWGKTKKLNSITLTLPPSIYNEGFVSKQVNSLFRKKFQMIDIELNHSYLAYHFDDNYIKNIRDNARKNLKQALNNELKFIICTSIEEKKLAYNIIRQHKESKGFPLHMTWEQVINTTAIIKADFFLIYDFHGTPIASAIFFYSGNSIVQLIYWGDLMEYHNLRTMNFLSFKIFEYYKAKKIKIVDLGPSTENSIPNEGLCNFKESIGCDVFTKISFGFNLNKN